MIQSTKMVVGYVLFCFFFLVSLEIGQGKIFLGYLLYLCFYFWSRNGRILQKHVQCNKSLIELFMYNYVFFAIVTLLK